jgi:imidazoleglycerol-phosphate dehydratase
MQRSAHIERSTSETRITLDLTLDGSGSYAVTTPVGFLNHMLELFARHGLFDLRVEATGDTQVDFHHTVEDVGICLGQAIKQALGSKAGIVRYGEATVPMDEAASHVSIDISGRPFLVLHAPTLTGKAGDFDTELVREFFQALTAGSAITVHITVRTGENTHHIIESIFKAFARALDRATRIDPRSPGIPSTKGIL